MKTPTQKYRTCIVFITINIFIQYSSWARKNDILNVHLHRTLKKKIQMISFNALIPLDPFPDPLSTWNCMPTTYILVHKLTPICIAPICIKKWYAPLLSTMHITWGYEALKSIIFPSIEVHADLGMERSPHDGNYEETQGANTRTLLKLKRSVLEGST